LSKPMKNKSSPAKRGSLPSKATRVTTSPIGEAATDLPPARRGLTKFERLGCERLNEEWMFYPDDKMADHVYVGFVDAQSLGGRVIVVDVEDDRDRWDHIEDPFVDEFGDPVPNEEADDHFTLSLHLRTAKRLMQRLQEAIKTLEIETEVIEAYEKIKARAYAARS
jgi:hypothetical protein